MPRWLWTATLLAALASSCKDKDPRAREVKPAVAASPAASPQPALPQAAAAVELAKVEAAKPEAAEPAKAQPVVNTELETKGLAAMERMADMFAADAKDCDKLAIDLKAFIAENRSLITQLIAYEESQGPDQREAFTRRNQATQAAIGHKMQGALTGCSANPAVLAAMKEFPGE